MIEARKWRVATSGRPSIRFIYPKTNIKPPSPIYMNIYITHLHPQHAVRRRRVVEARLHLLQQRLQPRLERAALPRGGLDGHECMWACGCRSVVYLVRFPPKRTYTCTSRPIPNPLIHPQSQKRIHMPPPAPPNPQSTHTATQLTSVAVCSAAASKRASTPCRSSSRQANATL